jgi:hypothetical protein
MKPLSELAVDMKTLVTATLIFLGVAILVALTYLDLSHIGSSGGPVLTVHDIAATYYGPGVGYVTLLSLAHIHMMGLSAVFFMVGYIFVHSSFPVRWKAAFVALPFFGFLVDVSGWFLTKLAYGCVYLVLFGGGVFVLSLVTMIVLSLYDMWLKPRTQMAVVASRQREATS